LHVLIFPSALLLVLTSIDPEYKTGPGMSMPPAPHPARAYFILLEYIDILY